MAEVITPPKVLSMEDYERYWKPKGWQLIIIGPTSTWRQEWGEWEAIRDIVQNALDEAEAYSYGYDQDGFWISDEGKGVAVADFLLGPPKLKPDWARGKFGEGMKIASLALIRKGYSVYVETVGRELYLVFLEQKVDGAAHTLAALWRPDGKTRGTTFHIIGYWGSDFADRFAVNIPRHHILWETPSPITKPKQRFNQLIKYPAGRIYARDIYMRDIKSPYSYNLWGFDMAPDRHGPQNESHLWIDMARLWCHVADPDLLENFIKMVSDPPITETEESREIRMDMWAMGRDPTTNKPYIEYMEENAEIWKEAWSRVFGDNSVLRTSPRWDSTVRHLGYISRDVSWGVQGAMATVITTDEELVRTSQKRLSEAQIIPDERLTPQQLAHLKLARVITQFFRYPPVSGVYAAFIPPASDRVRTAGMYSRTTMTIYISVDQLETASKTVDTVIHELAHHLSGAEDLEQAHSEWMTHVAARVVELATKGVFDDLIKEHAPNFVW